MKRQLALVLLVISLASFAAAQDFPGASGFASQHPAASDKEDALYHTGQSQLDNSDFAAAAKTFGDLAALKGRKADAALYWRAYAQNKSGDRQGAAATIAQLRRDYPASKWINDAGALEVEMHQASGKRVDPSQIQDEDLQIYAVNSLMQSDPDRAVPLLINVLNSNKSNKVKERALFVLAESGSPKADEALGSIAMGKTNPGLQRAAIQYIATTGSRKSQTLLADVYKSTTDVKIKRAVLQSYIVCDCKAQLLASYNTETDHSLRREAINNLGVMGAREDLHQIFSSSQDLEDKQAMLQAMAISGDSAYLHEVAVSNADPKLKIAAIRGLGISGGNSRDTLLSIYRADSGADVKNAVLESLFVDGDAASLISIAKSEKDPSLKRRAVEKLSIMDTKEARDYMMELLNQ